jgi:hypothetical protein
MMQIMFPGLFDIPLIFINLISAYILALSSYKLYKASRLATDESIKLLFLGFFMLFSSIVLSLTSFFIGDLFIFSSMVLFSIYLSISGYVLILLSRLSKIFAQPLLFPLTYYYAYGEFVAFILSMILALRSRSYLIITGFLLLSISHLFRFLIFTTFSPYEIVIVLIAEILRTIGFLSISIGLGVYR